MGEQRNIVLGPDPHGIYGDAQLYDGAPAAYCDGCRDYLPGEELELGLCEACQPTPFESEDEG